PSQISQERCKVVVNRQGRHAVWPAPRPIPPGWAEVLTPRSRSECLEYVGRAWTDLHNRPASSPAAVETRRRTVEFGLFFFGGDEEDAAREKYEFVIEVARYADAHGFSA